MLLPVSLQAAGSRRWPDRVHLTGVHGGIAGDLSYRPSPGMSQVRAIDGIGPSMDCQVFLLWRIRERYDFARDTAAIASGLQRTSGAIPAPLLVIPKTTAMRRPETSACRCCV